MGLLDTLSAQNSQGDALRQGLLGMGAGLLSGSRGSYGAFAPALGGGIAGFQSGMQNAQQMQQRDALVKMQQAVAAQKLAQAQAYQNFFNPVPASGGIASPSGATSFPVAASGPAGATAPAQPGVSAASPEIDDAKINQAIMSGNPALVAWGFKMREVQNQGSGSFAPQQSTNGYFHMNKDGTVEILKGPDGKPLMPITASPDTQGQVSYAKSFGTAQGKYAGNLPHVSVAAANALQGTAQQYDRLTSAATDLLSAPGLDHTLGLWGKIPNIPGSDAANADALKSTMRSQIAFSVLQSLRDASKTGGALGQVSDKEEQMLADNLAALDNAQSPEQYRKSLAKIIDFANQSKGRMQNAYTNMYGGGQPPQASTGAPMGASAAGGSMPAPRSAADFSALPSGTLFTAPDGSVRRKP